MSFRTAALPALLTAAALAAPAAAQGATLTAAVTKPCYGTNDRVALAGAGFTPDGQVTLMQGRQTLGEPVTADAAGNFSGTAGVQLIRAREERAPYTAIDQTDPSLRASTVPIRFSRTSITGRKAGDNGLIQLVRARGWTTGSRTLFVHARRGNRTLKTIKLGRLKGACRTLKVKKRIFGHGANSGVYQLYFDTYRRFKRGRAQQFRANFTVFRSARSSAAAAVAGLSSVRFARHTR